MLHEEYVKMQKLEKNHFWFVGKSLFIKQILDTLPLNSSRKILDVGCGTGGTTVILKKYGRVSAIEMNMYALNRAKEKNIHVLKGEVEKIPFPPQKFDLITVFDVLYHSHVKNLHQALSEVARVLKPGGHLLLTDSALPLLKSNHDRAMLGKRRFTTSQLEKILSTQGFIIIRSSYIFCLLFPIILLKRTLFDRISGNTTSDVIDLPSILNRLFILILSMEAWGLNKISYPFGSSLIILARKKNS